MVVCKKRGMAPISDGEGLAWFPKTSIAQPRWTTRKATRGWKPAHFANGDSLGPK